MEKLKKWFWNVLIGIDQFFNSLTLGDPDETISSRMGKHIKEGKCKLCKIVCYFLDKIDPNHCAKSIEPDEGGRGVL